MARTRRRRFWRALVPAVCLVAGFGFAASARDAQSAGGTDLRPPGTANLRDLVRTAEARVRAATAQVASVQDQVDSAAGAVGRADSAVAATQRASTASRHAGGLDAVHGPGLTVVLDDADAAAAGADESAGVDVNELVVHQDDLQAVVNALWAGGAEAMSIAGQRVIATSAVRCVGNTLLLNGQVFSPPFRVAAIGPARTMDAALAASPGVGLFRQAAEYFGLGFTVGTADDVLVPAYTGPLALIYARPVR